MPLGPPKSVQQLTHLTLTDKRMAQGQFGLDLVAVTAPMSLTQHVSLLDQLGENFVGAALGYANRSGDIAQSDAGILSDAKQNVGVAGEEVPTGDCLASRLADLCIISGINIHELMIHSLSTTTRPRSTRNDLPRRQGPPLGKDSAVEGSSIESEKGPFGGEAIMFKQADAPTGEDGVALETTTFKTLSFKTLNRRHRRLRGLGRASRLDDAKSGASTSPNANRSDAERWIDEGGNQTDSPAP